MEREGEDVSRQGSEKEDNPDGSQDGDSDAAEESDEDEEALVLDNIYGYILPDEEDND